MKLPAINILKWKQKFIQDFKKKEYMPIKFLFFLIFGANVSLIPFLTLQARSLGITEEEVGIIYSFIPIAALIAPPISGMIADRIGNFRILLSFLTALAGVSGVLFLVVPPGRIKRPLPQTLPMEVICSASIGNSLRVVEPFTCVPTTNIDDFKLDVVSCSVICLNTGNYSEAISKKISPANLNCRKSSSCMMKSSKKFSYFKGKETSKKFNSTLELIYSKGGNSTNVVPLRNSVIIQLSNQNETNGLVEYNSNELLCPKPKKELKMPKNCFTICEAEAKREQICKNTYYMEDINPSLTFYSHLVIRLFKEFTLATSMPLLEGAAVTILKQHGGDFGFQRLYCNIGMMLMTPISGTLIDAYSKINGFEDFRPAMYMYCGLKLLAAFIILFLNLDFKKASTKVISDFSSLMLNIEIILFLLATFLAGTCYGYIETFLFWLLEDLGADKQLMGLTVTVGSVFGIPLLMISTFIMRKLGHVNTIVLGFSVYILRLFGYTLISSPWWAMPFEALECFTVSLMVVSFVSYAAVLATPSTVVTLQGMYGGLYNGVGRGAGSLIGGFLIESIGIIQGFRVIAAIGGVSGLGYWIINVSFFRNKHRTSALDIEKENVPNVTDIIKEEKPAKIVKAEEQDKNDKIIAELANAKEEEIKSLSGTVNKGFVQD